MQSITFTNKNGDSLTFARGFPYLLESVRGIGAADSRLLVQRGFMQDGESYFDTLLEPRYIDADIWIKGTTRQDLLAKRAQVLKLFNPKLGQGTLRYTNDAGAWEIEAAAEGNPADDAILQNPLVQHFTIVLYCADPAWKEADEGEQSETLNAFNGGMVFPFEMYDEENTVDTQFALGTQGETLNVNNDGNLDAPVLIEFIGPGSRHRLTHAETGKQIELCVDLKSGESLFVDTNPQHIEAYRMIRGKKVLSFHYLKPESKYFSLNPGANHVMFSAAHGASSAVVKYTKRFVGV